LRWGEVASAPGDNQDVAQVVLACKRNLRLLITIFLPPCFQQPRKSLLRFAASFASVLRMNKITAKAIDQAGGTIAVGKALGITRQAVEQWKVVPPERVLSVERISGISRYELRPDIYGPAPKQARPSKRAMYQPAA
jgi:DNA-binding transcriptional regulator YdaS (Cro superfamily)